MGEPIRIRMYTVGFGDSFLLFLPTDDGIKKVFIDCGTIKQKKKNIAAIVQTVMKDVTDPDGVARIDLLVLSHRHKDHLSGFLEVAWSDVEVGEVWMPWVESPDDPDARALRREQNATAHAIKKIAALFAGHENAAEIAANALEGASALEIVRAGFAKKVKPRYLPTGSKQVEPVEVRALPGVQVFALGPPRDFAALKEPDPPNEQTLLSGYSIPPDADGPGQKFQPFSFDWVADPGVVLLDEFRFQEAASMTDLFELAAAKLDADINNTSLMLVFCVGKQVLLFPGDAQWGPWELLLQNDEAVDLLKKVTFLKVSHHASHNGSPATLMREVLGLDNNQAGKVHAMISVTQRGSWPIPHHPVLRLMNDKGWPYVSSDETGQKPGFSRSRDLWWEISLPT
jgi:beta-lactamase superfamily II metal-dependent hydrolase